jgi:hypothetical protein
MGIKQNAEKSLARNAAMESGVAPTYGGLKGNTLLYAIVAIATCGFSLFGELQFGSRLPPSWVMNM